MRNEIETAPALGVVAAFALGAAATFLVHAAIRRRHAPGPVSDDIVAQRVRARVAEIASEPDAVVVHVEQGVVRVSGELPGQERDELLASLVGVPGVWRVRNALGARRDQH